MTDTTTQAGIDPRQTAADAVAAAATAVAAHVGGRGAVKAETTTQVKLAQYAEAKRVLDAAEKRVDALAEEVHALFDAARADQFVNDADEVLLSRSEVLNRQRYDMALLERRAPKLFKEIHLPRTTHWRLSLPRTKRK